MLAAVTVIAALSRKWAVSRTDSGSRSRSSWAISSRPVASGTRTRPAQRARDVVGVGGLRVDVAQGRIEPLGPPPAVACPPALVGPVHDHRAQLQDPVD